MSTLRKPERALLSAVLVAVAAAGVIILIAGVGVLALVPLIALFCLMGYIRFPAALALGLWSLIALIPEWGSDISLAPALSASFYRSLVGPIDGADLVVLVSLLAAMSAHSTAPRHLVRQHKGLAILYAAWLFVVAISTVVNGQLAHPLLIKPLLYLGAALLWGYSIGSNPITASWTPVCVLVLSVIVGAQGLINSFLAIGLRAAGFNLAFYDRASVFLLIIVVLFVIQGWLARAPLTAGIRAPVWIGIVVMFVLAIALSLRRTMWFALAVGLVSIAALNMHRGFWSLVRRIGVGVLLTIGVGIGVLALLGSLEALQTHLISLLLTVAGHGQEQSITTRLFETSDVLRTFRLRPIIGAGPAGMYSPSFAYAPALDRTYVHDNYLWLLLHYGVVGLVTFLSFMATILWSLLKNYSKVTADDSAGMMRLCLGAGLLGLAVASAGDSFLTATHRWPLLLGFLVGAVLGLSDVAIGQTPAHGSASTKTPVPNV